MPIIKIDTKKIVDWESFHDTFAQAFGFPNFYGRNMDAWIDCMTYLDDAQAGMSAVHVEPGGVVTIELNAVNDFRKRVPEIYNALLESTAFVNWRRIELGDPTVLALSFNPNT